MSKTIIFDFDGTLADSLWAWNEVDKIYFGKRNIDFAPDIDNFGGMSLTEAAKYIKNKYNIPDTIDEIKDEWENIGHELYKNEVKPKPFAKECLILAKKKGYNTAIGSSNGKKTISLFLESNGIGQLVDYVLTSCEVGTGKPNPDIFLQIAKHFNEKAENCVVFEDTVEGVTAGKNAHMKTYAIEEKRHEKIRETIKEIADIYITSFEDIIKQGDF